MGKKSGEGDQAGAAKTVVCRGEGMGKAEAEKDWVLGGSSLLPGALNESQQELIGVQCAS